MVFGKEHPHHSSTLARCSECDSRCGVSDHERPLGLAAETSHIQKNCQPVRSNRSGYVCLTTDGSVPSLFQLVARSLCSGNRCLPAGLVAHQGVCQPTLEPGRSSSVQSTERSDPHCSGGSSLEDTAMVSSATADVIIAIPRLITHVQAMLYRDPEDLAPQLVVWHISGRDTETKSFQRKLPRSCSSHGELRLTTHSLANGIAGVVQGTEIPFQDL